MAHTCWSVFGAWLSRWLAIASITSEKRLPLWRFVARCAFLALTQMFALVTHTCWSVFGAWLSRLLTIASIATEKRVRSWRFVARCVFLALTQMFALVAHTCWSVFGAWLSRLLTKTSVTSEKLFLVARRVLPTIWKVDGIWLARARATLCTETGRMTTGNWSMTLHACGDALLHGWTTMSTTCTLSIFEALRTHFILLTGWQRLWFHTLRKMVHLCKTGRL